jgi:hypothetical protein
VLISINMIPAAGVEKARRRPFAHVVLRAAGYHERQAVRSSWTFSGEMR